MACFLVPAAEAVITTIAAKVVKSKEKGPETIQVQFDGTETEAVEKIPFSRKVKWLSNLLWGGSGLLAFEHVWHGELTAWFPFLSAANNPADLTAMLQEMATTGTAMAVLVTAVWAGMLAVAASVEKKAVRPRLVRK